MNIRYLFLVLSLLIISRASYAGQSSDSLIGMASTFSVNQNTQVPGETLKPGTYTIHVVDSLDDRMIVRVDRSSGEKHAVFLGVSHHTLNAANSPGPLSWKTGIHGSTALRGFQFARGSTVEFVYPKAEAVDLAKLNAAKVVAVDPESEGKPVLKDMSQDDLRLIHLWMLSLTTVTPNDKTPAILAQKYQNEDAPSKMALTPTKGSNSMQHQTVVASLEKPRLQQDSKPIENQPTAKQQHTIATLPHTASQVPLVVLCGLFSFLLAGGVRIIRVCGNKPVA